MRQRCLKPNRRSNSRNKRPCLVRSSEITAYALSGTRKAGLLILDDFYPNLTTGFRIAEYNHYLRVFPDLLIASTAADFRRQHAIFARHYPDVQNRVVAFDPSL